MTTLVGSVSHGTLRTPDLLRRFAFSLGILSSKHDELVDDARKCADEIDENPDHPGNNQTGAEIVDELFSALNECAPEGYYFGAHEGDGSDFGFWEIKE